MMITPSCPNLSVQQIAEFIEDLGRKPSSDEGFKFGDSQASVEGVSVC